MTRREDFLRRLDKIKVKKNGDERAPHKPLLLLLALGCVQREEPRLAYYENVAGELEKLLRHFDKRRKTLHPEAPFHRLPGDALWEVVSDTDLERIQGKGGITHRQLIRHAARGGFPSADHGLLRADPELVEEAAGRILSSHFASSLHDAIRDAVGLARPAERHPAGASRAARDPGFRHDVLRAYERRCAVCGFDVRLDDDLVGLDAAHIRWHSHGGPDEVRNGLALCILHHRTFDRGALGLEPEGESFRIVVSDEVNGQSPGFRQLLDCHGQPLRTPQRNAQRPAPGFVEWHRSQVFRGTPRDRCGA